MFGIEDFSLPIVDFGNFDPSQLGTAALFGGAILLIGMLTIFAVLFILWVCLMVFKYFFHDMANKEGRTEPESAPAPTAPVAPVYCESEEIVAVIAAAIAMAESESSGIKFKVVSFKRK